MDKDNEKEVKKVKKRVLKATFTNNTFIGGKFFTKGTHRVTEEQKNIIEDTSLFKKWEILTFKL